MLITLLLILLFAVTLLHIRINTVMECVTYMLTVRLCYYLSEIGRCYYYYNDVKNAMNEIGSSRILHKPLFLILLES